jgi:hypothetical protein
MLLLLLALRLVLRVTPCCSCWCCREKHLKLGLRGIVLCHTTLAALLLLLLPRCLRAVTLAGLTAADVTKPAAATCTN